MSLTYFAFSCIVRVYLSYRHFTKDAASLVEATVCLATHPILPHSLIWKNFTVDLSCLGFGFVYVVVVYAQLNSGYGTSIELLSTDNITTIQMVIKIDIYNQCRPILTYTIRMDTLQIFYLLLLLQFRNYLFFCFVARLTPHATYLKLCNVANALCVAWGTGGVFALALRCDLAEPWITIGERCTNLVSFQILRLREVGELTNKQLLRWQVISAFDVILEVAILGLVFGLVFNLQMPFRRKFLVVLGFDSDYRECKAFSVCKCNC